MTPERRSVGLGISRLVRHLDLVADQMSLSVRSIGEPCCLTTSLHQLITSSLQLESIS